jgi:hypothetical protein
VIVDFYIAGNVSQYFLFPELRIGGGFFFGFEVFAVEEFAINEYGEFYFFEGEVGFAEDGFVVFSVAVAD